MNSAVPLGPRLHRQGTRSRRRQTPSPQRSLVSRASCPPLTLRHAALPGPRLSWMMISIPGPHLTATVFAPSSLGQPKRSWQGPKRSCPSAANGDCSPSPFHLPATASQLHLYDPQRSGLRPKPSVPCHPKPGRCLRGVCFHGSTQDRLPAPPKISLPSEASSEEDTMPEVISLPASGGKRDPPRGRRSAMLPQSLGSPFLPGERSWFPPGACDPAPTAAPPPRVSPSGPVGALGERPASQQRGAQDFLQPEPRHGLRHGGLWSSLVACK